MIPGFDVSQWQVPGVYPTGMAFGIAKATEGLEHDPLYARHYTALRKLGLVVGAYHFNFPTRYQPAEKQAERFLAVADNADLLFLDCEKYSDKSGPGFTDAEADQFVRYVQRAGRRILLYHSASGFPSNKAVHFNGRWVADYRLAARIIRRPLIAAQWTFWQWTSSGATVGDRDWFNGDAAKLAALVANSHV